MKLLFCENCGDLVVPEKYGDVRWCNCRYSCCWWDDSPNKEFVVYSHLGKEGCSIIGINNALLTTPFTMRPATEHQVASEHGCIEATAIQKLLDETPEHYLFRQVRSLVIRIRPEFTRDTRIATHDEVKQKSLVNR